MYIMQGINHGFSIGFHEDHISLRPSQCNSQSAYEHPQVVDRYLQTECELGRVLGPFAALPADALHISRFGVIPKKSQPGKWQLIVDLSAPEGHSVNEHSRGALFFAVPLLRLSGAPDCGAWFQGSLVQTEH